VGAQEVAEIASVRLLVEPYAGELALEALRGPGRARLTQTLADLNRATETNDIPASIDAHLQFHRLFYELSGHGVLGNLWNGWETKLRLYLMVDHRSYGELHDIAVEHERLAAVALEGDTEAFRQELARHFQSALRGQTEDPDPAPVGHP
jgi:DNA-binding GntR family transcriptional regulator